MHLSIIKHVSTSYDTDVALKNLCRYVIDKKKTMGFYGGRGLAPDFAFEEMQRVQMLWGKTTGRRAFHFILGFDDAEAVTPTEALEIGFRVSSLFFPSRQVVYGVHITQSHLHVHFVINTVSMLDGHKLSLRDSEWYNLTQQVYGVAEQFILA